VKGVGPLAADAVATVDTAVFARGSFTAADGTVLPYRILPPADIVPGTWWRDWLFQQKQTAPH